MIAATLACMVAVPAAFWLADSGLLPWSLELSWYSLRAKNDAGNSSLIASDFVELRRGPCFGDCPVYSVKLYASGRVEFDGKENVCAQGTHVAQVDPVRARELIHDIDAARTMDLTWPADSWISDASDATLRLSISNDFEELWHYLGDTGAPRMLRNIENEIDTIAGVARWLLCPKPDVSRR